MDEEGLTEEVVVVVVVRSVTRSLVAKSKLRRSRRWGKGLGRRSGVYITWWYGTVEKRGFERR